MKALLASCLVAAASAAQPAEIRARFIGNMALQLTDGRVTLRSDFPCDHPYQTVGPEHRESGYSGYMTWNETFVPAATGEALCLITHSHRDHFLASLAASCCASATSTPAS